MRPTHAGTKRLGAACSTRCPLEADQSLPSQDAPRSFLKIIRCVKPRKKKLPSAAALWKAGFSSLRLPRTTEM